MSTSNVLGLAVSPQTPQPSGSSKKRKITPSFEQSASKHSLILSTPKKSLSSIDLGVEIPTQPFFAPKRLFPRGVATVVHQYTHSHPAPSEREEENEGWHNKHILLPFDLRDPNVDILAKDVTSILRNIFPGTLSISEGRHRSQVSFEVSELPTTPWPLTIGGLPFTIGDQNQGRALIFPRLNLGNFSISICQQGYDVNGSCDKVLRNLAADVNAQFQVNLPGIPIVELMFTSARTLYIIVEDHININARRRELPGKIAGYPVGYLNDKQLHRPLWADLSAKQQIQPQPIRGIVDNTAYDILRPGVMISSRLLKEHAHPEVFSSTSGVLVENRVGDRFMTGASHGIGRFVWQAGQAEKIIAEAVVEIPFTDISLLALGEDVTFVNETFENANGAVPSFTRLVTSEDTFEWGISNLNGPYTGSMESCTVAKSVKFERPSHPTQDRLKYVVYSWAYTGQEEGNDDKVRPPDGTCGSVIRDDDGLVLGFYHYYIEKGPWAGFSASVSASEVVEAGYRLAK
ncbi:hypothetical protein NKR23_g3797 [Pleurostoma richardsiae]|uniref:Uncharacterized protein n=1 Tax=Pleurostoma richardsiae TaxID=41990 RepID=A0AA38RK83_9PEZI|nr:hypothetical protein NKR23_g3797 [Pleurostoma richardsiae]